MKKYTVGFDGRWQESFDDLDDAITWAREVAATGRTVEVIGRRFGLARFVTAFPESERDTLKARWNRSVLFDTGFFGGADSGGRAHNRYGSAMVEAFWGRMQVELTPTEYEDQISTDRSTDKHRRLIPEWRLHESGGRSRSL